jgi:N-6 DNA methylase
MRRHPKEREGSIHRQLEGLKDALQDLLVEGYTPSRIPARRLELGRIVDRVHSYCGQLAQGWRFSSHAAPNGNSDRVTRGHFGSANLAALVSSIGRLARVAYDAVTEDQHRRRYGQYFTPPTISALTCAAAIPSKESAVLDPMCGVGAMIWAANQRLEYLRGSKKGAITGIEVDPLPARVAALPQCLEDAQTVEQLSVEQGDAFLAAGGFSRAQSTRVPDPADAVVTNPPYVRYQNLASLLQESSSGVVQAFVHQLPKAMGSEVANTIIRACLVGHLVDRSVGGLRARARELVAILQSKSPHRGLASVDACWLELVKGYSGLADLSLPSWLLAWRFAGPEATIGFVTTATWRSREYSRTLRYFMFRFLEPLLVIEQEGNTWFGDALVPTSLLVLRKRSPEEAEVPLADRRRTDHLVRIVRVKRSRNLAEFGDLKDIVSDLAEADSRTKGPSLALTADLLIKEIKSLDDDLENRDLKVELVPEQILVADLLREVAATTSPPKRASGIRAMEGVGSGSVRAVGLERVAAALRHVELPYALTRALGFPHTTNGSFGLLADYGIEAHQGLRTGCNSFFYVRRLELEEVRDLVLQEALPKNIARHVARTEDSWDDAPYVMVRFSGQFGGRVAVFPKAFLWPVVRYQKNLNRWTVSATKGLLDHALVTGSAAHPRDYSRLARFPSNWVKIWRARDGLRELPRSLAAYIDLGAKTAVETNGNKIPIPRLSAVAPNARLPHRAEIDSVPPAPSWWYTISIKSRHVGQVFLPRVNHISPSAYLNSADSPALIDANFITFSANGRAPGETLSSYELFAFLNSVWAKTLFEVIATPLGGGALKVDAAHARLLPVPRLDSVRRELDGLGRRLARNSYSCDASRTLEKVDDLITGRVASLIGWPSTRLRDKVGTLGGELVARRKR